MHKIFPVSLPSVGKAGCDAFKKDCHQRAFKTQLPSHTKCTAVGTLHRSGGCHMLETPPTHTFQGCVPMEENTHSPWHTHPLDARHWYGGSTCRFREGPLLTGFLCWVYPQVTECYFVLFCFFKFCLAPAADFTPFKLKAHSLASGRGSIIHQPESPPRDRAGFCHDLSA